MIADLIKKNRSYRRFYENEPINMETLKYLVDLARLSPSASNSQPLKYILSNELQKNNIIFPHLAWAGFLKNWSCPEPGERPPAYIMILGDQKIKESFDIDPGIAAQSILLGAVEKGLGGCIFGSIQRKKLQIAMKIPEQYMILYIIALGKPKEKVVIDTIVNDDIKYWRDANQVHHVPKRTLEEIILPF